MTVKKSKKRPKTKKKAKPRQRKQQYTTPVDAYKDLVRPKGVRFGQGWLPYVQRLTFEAIPPTSNYYGNFSRMNTIPQPPQGQLSGPTLKDVRAMIDEASQTNYTQIPGPRTRDSTATTATGSDPMPRRPLTPAYEDYVPLPVELQAMQPNVPAGPPSAIAELIPIFWDSLGIGVDNRVNTSEIKARESKLESALLEYWSTTVMNNNPPTNKNLNYLLKKLTKSGKP